MNRNVESRRTLWRGTLILSLVFFTLLQFTQSQVYAVNDTEPPTSNITLIGNRIGSYFIPPVTVVITATDTPSGIFQGIAYTSYRINSGTWTPYTEPFEVRLEGVYNISYYSEDRSGNPEAVKTTQFEINFNPPTLTPTPTQIQVATPTPEPTATATPSITQGVSPSVIPTKSETYTGQAYPASFPYYRSPTKTPTPIPSKVKTVTSNRPIAPQVALTARETFSPTPSPQVMNESERPDNNEPPAVLGKWTRTDNDRPESSAPWHMLIMAVMTAGGYIFFVYYLYLKTSG